MSDLIPIDRNLSLNADDMEFSAVRSRGPGGQHVNTTSTAIQLRFDVRASTLPEALKERLLKMSDHRITADGIVIIKAQTERSQERNRQAAIERLVDLIKKANYRPKKRIATKPTRASKKRRVDSKVKRGHIKNLRGRVRDE